MLGLFLIYWVGKAFYELAEKHNRNAWGHGIFGVAVYYIVQIVFALVCFIIIDARSDSYTAVDDSEMGVSILAILVGALGCWGYYLFIKGRWEREVDNLQEVSFDSELLDDELLLS